MSFCPQKSLHLQLLAGSQRCSLSPWSQAKGATVVSEDHLPAERALQTPQSSLTWVPPPSTQQTPLRARVGGSTDVYLSPQARDHPPPVSDSFDEVTAL